MESAAALRPPPSGTSGWMLQPRRGPSMASSRSARASLSSGSALGPAAHTTISPADHDAWSRTSPAGSALSTRAGRVVGGDQPVVGRLEERELLLEVGHHLVPLGPGELADRVEAVLGVVQQLLEDAPPRARVRLERRDLLGCRSALGCRPDGDLRGSTLHRACGSGRSLRRPPGTRGQGAPVVRHLGRTSDQVPPPLRPCFDGAGRRVPPG